MIEDKGQRLKTKDKVWRMEVDDGERRMENGGPRSGDGERGWKMEN